MNRVLLALLLTACTSASHAPTSHDAAQLAAAVERGDLAQADAAVAALPSLDGGDLEDVMRALGSLAAREPAAFLDLMVKHQLPPPRVAAIVRMLPLSTVDDPPRRLQLIRERMDALRGVTD